MDEGQVDEQGMAHHRYCVALREACQVLGVYWAAAALKGSHPTPAGHGPLDRALREPEVWARRGLSRSPGVGAKHEARDGVLEEPPPAHRLPRRRNDGVQ